jgi:hypothetical protein
MTVTKYTYSIANDFPVTGLDSNRLLHEIQASAITVAVDRIDTDDDVCDIWFKDALGATDKTALDGDTTAPAGGLIAAHSGQPMEVVTVAPVILEPTGNSEKNLRIFGDKFTATLNSDTNKDVSFSESRSIQGVSFEIVNAHEDDWVRLSIIHPATQEELQVMAEGPSGTGVPVPVSGSASVVSEGTAELPSGVPIRVTYHSAATSGDAPVIRLQFRTWV